jgi:hypothetical protein
MQHPNTKISATQLAATRQLLANKGTWQFNTVIQRDAFLSDVFPDRRCTAQPGVYHVTGGTLIIRGFNVFFHEMASAVTEANRLLLARCR